ncbi:hypothetical protein GCM10022288_25040 [Gryllotalpicola kribbensis]|uniref:Flippase-like domain-containing protein n=1 Tax=Gryllotalpicola kribbensis TaxID=993084 RepID=A0ABP8AX42_9MICO
MSADASLTVERAEATRRGWTWKILTGYGWRAVVLALVGVLLWRAVVPQFGEAWRASRHLTFAAIPFVVLGLLLELGAFSAYAGMTYSALPHAERPRYRMMWGVNITGIAITNTMPAGGAVTLGYRFRMLDRMGTPRAVAAGSLMMEMPVSSLALSALFVIAVAVFLPASLEGGEVVAVAFAVVVVFVAAATAMFLAAVRCRGVMHMLLRVLPSAFGRRAARFVGGSLAAMAALASDRGRLGATAVNAMTNWACDSAAFCAFLAMAGPLPTIRGPLLAYALTSVISLVPITPGGLGVVEAVLVPTLVGFGVSPSHAALGVTTWRLAQFWLPIALGGSVGVVALTRAGVRRTSRVGAATLR